MTAASPAAPPPVGDPGMNGHAPGHSINLPRFHPIAINPNGTAPTSSGPPSYHHSYGPSILDHTNSSHHPPSPLPPPILPAPSSHQYQHQQTGSGPPPQSQQHTSQPPSRPPSHPPLLPVPVTSQLDQIEVRLRQIEQEEAGRAAARAHMLALRRREDEEFRAVTERAEAEEDELRRRRKRLKRESMGLIVDGQIESPPPPASRRLSETSAATTLAFFKQQSPPELRPTDLRLPQPPHPASHPPPPHHHHHHHPSPAIIQQPTPMAPVPNGLSNPNLNNTIMSNGNGVGTGGTFRKKQKYTIKNAEAWGERHGRPATYDAAGRALWKRPSDGQLVYLDCPAPDCGKSDFVTLHGFMCHLTKKHKDRSMGSQSRALDLCGSVYDPNAPRPQRPSLKGGSTGDSRAGSVHTEAEVEEEEEVYSSSISDVAHEDEANKNNTANGNGSNFPREEVVKKEITASPVVTAAAVNDSSEYSSSSHKASIASMIDSNDTPDAKWTMKKPSTPVEEAASSKQAETEVVRTITTATPEDAAAAAVLAGRTANANTNTEVQA